MNSASSVNVSTWRGKNADELDKCLEVLKTIRDDPEAKDKDKIDATIAIGRLLGAVMADGRSAKGRPVDTKKPEHTKSVRDEVEKWLDEID